MDDSFGQYVATICLNVVSAQIPEIERPGSAVRFYRAPVHEKKHFSSAKSLDEPYGSNT